jgi:hypothetical protein
MIITRIGRSGAGVLGAWFGKEKQGGETKTLADARTRHEVFAVLL